MYSGIFGWKWGDSSSKYWSSYTLSTDYFASKKDTNVLYNDETLDKKIEQVYKCIEQALSHNQYDIHFYEI